MRTRIIVIAMLITSTSTYTILARINKKVRKLNAKERRVIEGILDFNRDSKDMAAEFISRYLKASYTDIYELL